MSTIEKILADHTAQDNANFKELQERLDKIEKLLARQQGFIGGVVFIVASLFAVITVALGWLKS